MATPPVSLRIPSALLALIDAKAADTGQSRTEAILDTLQAALAPMESDPRPEPPRALEGTPRRRDTAPRLKDAPTAQGSAAAGIVSGLDLPLGNSRPPMQRGAGAKGKR